MGSIGTLPLSMVRKLPSTTNYSPRMRGKHMQGIELGITDDGRLAIRCLEHEKTHTKNMQFCCIYIMVKAMSLGIRSTANGFHARMAAPEPRLSGLSGLLFDIATTPLYGLNPEMEDNVIE